MSETICKLAEAEYFLRKAKERLGEPQEFVFNLSAFLSAARSVTFIMKCEFMKCSGFENWYTAKEAEMKEDPDCKFFNDLRRATVHLNPVTPNRRIEMTVSSKMNLSDNPIVVPITEGRYVVKDDDSSRSMEIDIKHSWRFQERLADDGLELCNRHIQRLRKLVEECEAKFREQINDTP